MTTGLLIKDSSGRVVMDPNTFTVRMVTAFNHYGGQMAFGEQRLISVPAARTGMFVQLSPLWQYGSGVNLQKEFIETRHWQWEGEYIPNSDQFPCLPSAYSTNGGIVIYAPSINQWARNSGNYPSTRVLADVAVYLLVHI